MLKPMLLAFTLWLTWAHWLRSEAIQIHCGTELPRQVCSRVHQLVQQVPQPTHQDVLLELGTRQPDPDLPAEGFIWQAQQKQNQLRIQVWGQRSANHHRINRGLLYGVYALLERLGFAFNHPFQPHIPLKLNLPQAGEQEQQAPFWPQRGLSHHTMHPLELTHVLNGWGPGGPSDHVGWESLRKEWEYYLEWLIANRQNEVEWVLLEKSPWLSFSRSALRQKRLQALVAQAHAWGLEVGIDAPMALSQQNAWRLLVNLGSAAEETRQIQENLDWLMAAGFDFVTTEMGLSEFHNAGDQAMLDWLNTATRHLAERYGRPLYVKVHISQGQYSQKYRDPVNGTPLNFNFLPHYADPRLGILPHTVQIYSLDDPAPTYGLENFSEMFRFIQLEAGHRPLLWFPETSYWVNYDINVPLFLPVYAARRLHDLCLLGGSRLPGNHRKALPIQGQMLFSSGFEWGYWLNDRIAARAAWDPAAGKLQEEKALEQLLRQALSPAGATAEAWTRLLLDTISAQYRLLIRGEVQGHPPSQIALRNGMAYLVGADTWSELSLWIRQSGLLRGFQTQPDRLEPIQVKQDPKAFQFYLREIQPLLAEIYTTFSALARRAEDLQNQNPSPLTAEFRDGLAINALRAQLIYSQYEQAARLHVGQRKEALRWLQQARESVAAAERIVQRREMAYRTDPERIAGWGTNPTAYRYGYLWQVRSLHFWKRDLQVMETGITNPCRMNIIDPLEVGLPDPEADSRALWIRRLSLLLPTWQACFHPPKVEPGWVRPLQP